ncbi:MULTISPECIES: transcription antitermination factor NusB [unclassified Thioalkalivibrio]|uniref:transcription antitermination factor NusB n=1 Tax=unclassified Thioalkalivibrio TaxID=2621013 RepID=UPI0009DB17C0|nr:MULTISPECIES: transcription antitermination factor NusB [unclassified Thioalkalivibrio]
MDQCFPKRVGAVHAVSESHNPSQPAGKKPRQGGRGKRPHSTPEQRARHARSVARRRAMQALYSWQMTAAEPKDILAEFRDDEEHAKADAEYFREILIGVTRNREALDARMEPYLGRPLDQLDPVERALLWLGQWELAERIDVPYRVVINEAVDLAKRFGAEQSHRYINGVLDRLSADLRGPERSAQR